MVDLSQRKVIYVTNGKDATTVDLFTRDVTAHRGTPEAVKIVACDMSLGFKKGIDEHFINSSTVIDKFHGIKHINEAVDEVRREELRQGPWYKYLLNKTKYLWLKNDANLTEHQHERKESLLKKPRLPELNALLPKSYIADFLTKKQVKNRGVIPQYYVTGNYEPIIPPETFELVQAEMSRRKTGRGKYNGVSIFSSRIKCGECGSRYGSKVWHSNDAYRRVIWQCNHKFEGTKCSSPHFTEEELKEIFVRAFNQLFESRKEILENISLVQQTICATDKFGKQQRLADELQVVTEMAHNAIPQNATVAQDQVEYPMKYDELMKRYEDTKTAYEKTVEEIAARKNKGSILSSFAKTLRRQEHILDDFDEGLWGTLVESMIVHGKDNI